MKKKFLKSLTISLALTAAFLLNACTHRNDNLTWENVNSVYAEIKADYKDDILADVEGAFETLRFQKIYVTKKDINQWSPITLLFILDETGDTKQEEFIRLLTQDERVMGAQICRDLPYQSVNNQYIEAEKTTISVGESIKVTLKGGSADVYIQPFNFGGLFVKPNIDKDYTLEDFQNINLKSVTKKDNGWFYLELKEENYFNLIKALDILSRLSTMEEVVPDQSNVFPTPPPSWQVSDPTIVDIKTNSENYETAVITGLKAGTVTVEWAGVQSIRCEIRVK